MTINAALFAADTYAFWQAVRNMRSGNVFARAHARILLRTLSIDTPFLGLADACARVLRTYPEASGHEPINYFPGVA